MRKITALILLAGLCLGLLGGCMTARAADLTEGIVKNDLPADADLGESGGLNRFAVELLKGSWDGSNQPLVSPLSVIAALAMMQNGAQGETLQQMEQTIGLSAADLSAWLLAYRSALAGKAKPEGVGTLHLANGIWFRDDPELQVEKDFLQTNVDYLEAAIWKAPFDSSTVKHVNDWVEENTQGMIRDILDELDENSLLVLANALAFEAEWNQPYQDGQVRDKDFTLENGSTVTAELMHDTSYMPYLELENAAGFLRRYRGGQFAFLGLLPEEGVSMTEFLASLDGEALAAAAAGAQTLEVRTSIPQFKAEFDAEMSDMLAAMGMPRAFTPAAQFGAMGSHPDGLLIGRVLHKTFIQVDQKGTKAGAATVVGMSGGTGAPVEKPEPKEVYLERPFVYGIWDLKANIPVFLGVCTQP